MLQPLLDLHMLLKIFWLNYSWFGSYLFLPCIFKFLNQFSLANVAGLEVPSKEYFLTIRFERLCLTITDTIHILITSELMFTVAVKILLLIFLFLTTLCKFFFRFFSCIIMQRIRVSLFSDFTFFHFLTFLQFLVLWLADTGQKQP